MGNCDQLLWLPEGYLSLYLLSPGTVFCKVLDVLLLGNEALEVLVYLPLFPYSLERKNIFFFLLSRATHVFLIPSAPRIGELRAKAHRNLRISVLSVWSEHTSPEGGAGS